MITLILDAIMKHLHSDRNWSGDPFQLHLRRVFELGMPLVVWVSVLASVFKLIYFCVLAGPGAVAEVAVPKQKVLSFYI